MKPLQVIPRKTAQAQGLKRFYTGRPCIHGHVAERLTTTGGCVKCNADRSKQFASNAHKGQIARLQGHFSYPLHPDDHAAALAYCQALDAQRGHVPHVPVQRQAPTQQMTDEALALRIAATRASVIGMAIPKTVDEIDPMEQALLRDCGLLQK